MEQQTISISKAGITTMSRPRVAEWISSRCGKAFEEAEAQHPLQACQSTSDSFTPLAISCYTWPLFLLAPASVLAAANPRFGSYDELASSADQARDVPRPAFLRRVTSPADGLRNHHPDTLRHDVPGEGLLRLQRPQSAVRPRHWFRCRPSIPARFLSFAVSEPPFRHGSQLTSPYHGRTSGK